MAAESSAVVGGGAGEEPPTLQAMKTLPLELGEDENDSPEHTDKDQEAKDKLAKEAAVSGEEAPVDIPPRGPMSAREIMDSLSNTLSPISARLMATFTGHRSSSKSEPSIEAASPRPDMHNVDLASPPTAPPKRRPSTEAEGSFSLLAQLSASLSRTIAALTPTRAPEPDPAVAAAIPARFLAACKGDKRKALAKWQACEAWRAKHDIDHILTRPYPKWDVIKKCYPQAIHGRGLKGEPLSIETPAKLDTEGLKAAGVTAEDMSLHLALLFEYVFAHMKHDQYFNDGEEVVTLTIMDCKDISLTKAVSFDNLAIVKATTEVIDKYYPNRVHKIFVVNTPRFFGPVFNVIKGALPGSMGSTIEILYDIKELHKHVSVDVLPPNLGGSGVGVGQAKEERDLYDLIYSLNNSSNKALLQPQPVGAK